MDTGTSTRGRGARTNGVSRGGHQNKRWIAPGHGASASQSREGSAHTSDGERWERGGGPRRGRGRGRGTARPSTNLTLTVKHPEEAYSGTEDEEESQDVSEVEYLEDEETTQETEEADPETPEERERFYQELVKAREAERKMAIAEGKMDDPNVPKRLEDAITMVGTCMDMCPRFERYRRERENNLDRWEVIPGTKRVDHKRAVKIYERAAGDKVIPSDLRPPKVLKRTLDYLFHDLIAHEGFSETYNFIRDRSRAVRNDFTIQHDTGPLAIECHDRCARFHILAMHLERENSGFSLAMEEQQLMYTLQSLKEFYTDQRGTYSAATELEMRVYHRLIHIRDQRERHDDIPQEILSHPVFELTTKFRLHVQAKSAPITKTSQLRVDAEGMQIFGELAGHLRSQNNVVMIFLVACIIERLFGKGTVDGIEDIKGELTISEIIDGISKPLHATPPQIPTPPSNGVHTDAPAVKASALTNTFPGPASNGSSAQAVPPPTQSAFSNLTARPNPFGGATSVFGGPVFGATSSSFGSAPKSAFGSAPPSVFGQTFTITPTPASQPSTSTSPFTTVPSPEPAKPSSSAAPFVFGSNASSATVEPSKPAPLFPSSSAPPTIASTSSNNFFSGTAPPASAPPALNPNAPSFIAPSLFPKSAAATSTSAAPQPVQSTPGAPPNLFGNVTQAPPIVTPAAAAAAPAAPAAPATPPNQPPPAATATPRRQVVDRSQTLWDFPGKAAVRVDTSFIESGTPTEPPQLGRAPPMALPPTPTARWFEAPTQLSARRGESLLSLRKQSLLSLQMPDAPTHAEILSPLALPSPGLTRSSALQVTPTPGASVPRLVIPSVPAAQDASPTPRASAFAETYPFPRVPPPEPQAPFSLPPQSAPALAPQPAPAPAASTSHAEIQPLVDSPVALAKTVTPSPRISPKGKGKGKEAEMDIFLGPDVTVKLAKEFARSGHLVRRCFKKWKRRATDRALYAEAFVRSELYTERLQREGMSSSVSSVTSRTSEGSVKRQRRMADGGPMAQKKHAPRKSTEFQPRRTDDALSRTLKETAQEHERRWARGSFVNTVRARVVTDAPDGVYPKHWRIWLSTNTVNDGTAIWVQHKLDVPESGEWFSKNVFSIPVMSKHRHPPSPGSPGLIVFERTPLGDLSDDIAKKYRILDDCARLRDVLESVRRLPKLRYTPALLSIAWANEAEQDAAPDFDDMVRRLVSERVLRAAESFTVSATEKDPDGKFDDALSELALDFRDKTTVTLTWKGLAQSFVAPFRTYASDWLDSCWANSRETLDWAHYGEVVRSVEEVQATLVQELLGLLNVRDPRVPISVETPVHAHLDEAYASGIFLDTIVDASIKKAEEILGDSRKQAYELPKERFEATMQRFDTALQSAAERLRLHAATSLASRSAQKRRASESDDFGDSPSSAKRAKASPTPTPTDVSEEEEEEPQASGLHTPPATSSAPSSAAVSEAQPKPQVTVAMLRALAQGILKAK